MSFFRTTFMTAYRSRLYPNYWDILALVLVLAVISLFAWNAKQMATPYQLGEVIPLSLNPKLLPLYAARTVVRMLIALFFSLLFTFIFGTWAAKSRRAGRLIIPIIDVLQSVPILGFLSVTVAVFIGLFPGSLLGPECAAIFAIFTSQAWNMALGFYQTVRSVPSEVNEAGRMFHLSAWQRFWRIDVPYSMPGLLWNAMVSMSAGWFFVVVSEAVSVANQDILLPGIGSYIALAIKAMNMKAIFYAIITMLIVILIYDQLLFRPLVAWAEKFKAEQVGEDREVRSWVIDLFHRTRLLRIVGQKFNQLFDGFVNFALFRTRFRVKEKFKIVRRYDKLMGMIWDGLIFISVASVVLFAIYYVLHNVPFSEVKHVFYLGLITAFRV